MSQNQSSLPGPPFIKHSILISNGKFAYIHTCVAQIPQMSAFRHFSDSDPDLLPCLEAAQISEARSSGYIMIAPKPRPFISTVITLPEYNKKDIRQRDRIIQREQLAKLGVCSAQNAAKCAQYAEQRNMFTSIRRVEAPKDATKIFKDGFTSYRR